MRTEEQSEVRSPKSEVNFVGRSGDYRELRTSDLGLWTILLAAVLFVASAARADDARKPTSEAIGSEVQCSCGCVAPLNQCPMLNCAEKAEMRAFITKEIADGKGETAILQDLSLRYGLQVLSAPPARGFNLAVWILPGVGLLIGLGMVVVIVRRWKRKPAVVPTSSSSSSDPKVLSAVEEEMKSAGLGRF
jgi:cytochrome c-type biogenesis protein CcmH